MPVTASASFPSEPNSKMALPPSVRFSSVAVPTACPFALSPAAAGASNDTPAPTVPSRQSDKLASSASDVAPVPATTSPSERVVPSAPVRFSCARFTVSAPASATAPVATLSVTEAGWAFAWIGRGLVNPS